MIFQTMRKRLKALEVKVTQERFHKTKLNEFSPWRSGRRSIGAGRRLGASFQEYNEHRSHQGPWLYDKTRIQTFIDSVPLAKEKMLAA